jgi:antitoxin (DNA-binding transcriptional repressor) of toxin-antitoxin stability system
MENRAITVTEASRNFAECVNQARYLGTSFLLVKGRVPVARIVPASYKPTRGVELADALRDAVAEVHLGEKEATSWLHDLEQSRGVMPAQVSPWHF